MSDRRRYIYVYICNKIIVMLKMINIILQKIILNNKVLLDIKSDQQIIIIDSWSREIIIKVIYEMR